MSVTLTTRASKELARKIEELAKKEQVDKSTIIRKLLKEAVERKSLEDAIEQYKKGKLSLWKAARNAGVSLWEMIDVLAKEGVYFDYDREALGEDLEPLRRKESGSGK
jgi:predicted HTH domain antitoxin